VKPTVLVATTSLWFPTARLAIALDKAGFTVEAVCPRHHPLSTVSVVRRTHAYNGIFPISSLANALANAKPDLIVPGDDLAARHLHVLYLRESRNGARGVKNCSLIEASLGSPESFPVVFERATFMRLAEELGVRVPQTVIVENDACLARLATEIGFPAMLKADGTSGGSGVRIVNNVEEATNAYRELKAPPLLARAAKRALIDRDQTLVWPSLLRRHSRVSAQTMIRGHEVTSTVACWKGTVLAALHFEVAQKLYRLGPATVMRFIQNAEIANAVEKVVRHLNLSGIHGFDFMLESNTGNTYLIEINPRATQVGHLTLGPGRDLPAALFAAVTGGAIQNAPKVTENETIALFPQEWTRDPASPLIGSAYHDVPWEEPSLVEACIRYALRYSKRIASKNGERVACRHTAPMVLIHTDLENSRK
jgi:carbamoylphosphate synthase large subunit